MTGAGLLRRYAAWSLDALLIAVPALLSTRAPIAAGLSRIELGFQQIAGAMAQNVLSLIDRGGTPDQLYATLLQDAGMQAAALGLAAAVLATLWPPMLAFALVGWVYYTGFEGSRWQATPGKRWLGLRVTALDGSPPGFARAGLRQLAGALSWLTLNLGHAWAAKPPERRALHDRLAGARVVQAMDTQASLPLWARLLLLAQAAAFIVALVWLYRVANAATSRAFDALL